MCRADPVCHVGAWPGRRAGHTGRPLLPTWRPGCNRRSRVTGLLLGAEPPHTVAVADRYQGEPCAMWKGCRRDGERCEGSRSRLRVVLARLHQWINERVVAAMRNRAEQAAADTAGGPSDPASVMPPADQWWARARTGPRWPGDRAGYRGEHPGTQRSRIFEGLVDVQPRHRFATPLDPAPTTKAHRGARMATPGLVRIRPLAPGQR
jgi:hypothetical protein